MFNDMHVYVYVLKSESSGQFYIGISKFKAKRTRQHNRGESPGTRGKGPWVEVFREPYDGYKSARRREKFLKTGKGRDYLHSTYDY